jgi:leader peptidase (prepilin peptidase) / N-methyltransferase
VTAVVALAAVLAGALVVGPALNRAILAWVGENVVVPAVLGRPLADGEVSPAPVRCPHCGHGWEWRLGPLALAPWLAAGGRCRSCRVRRPWWWLAVEATTALAFGAVAARFGWSAELPAVLAFAAGLVALSAVDVVYLRIPTRFVYATAAVVVAAMAYATGVGAPPGALASAALGAAGYGGVFVLYWLLWRGGLGFGDVRLATVVGLVAGWLAWDPRWPAYAAAAVVVQAAFVAACAGVVVGVALLVVRRASRPFAFGPCIALGGAYVVLVHGPLT